ncbi:MAG: FAD/NAD(P)-binding protein [Sphingobacterium sp.]
MQQNIHVAIIGGGPSGLFMYKRLVEKNIAGLKVSIFESRKQLGAGMPYSYEGATPEHLTNVSDHEIPALVSTIEDYVQSLSETTLRSYGIDVDDFNRYKVMPRLLLGRYLSEQFMLLKRMADEKGIETQIHLGSQVSDIIDLDSQMQVKIMVGSTDTYIVDKVIICTGHKWPTRYEGNVEHYFESPYPPSKLALKTNHAVGIRGASLTAIDAIRTLARHNGSFEVLETGELRYQIDPGSENFKLLMHTRSGLLPAIRFHQEEPFLANKLLISEEELMLNRLENEGFVSLDFLFDRNFKAQFKERIPTFMQL